MMFSAISVDAAMDFSNFNDEQLRLALKGLDDPMVKRHNKQNAIAAYKNAITKEMNKRQKIGNSKIDLLIAKKEKEITELESERKKLLTVMQKHQHNPEKRIRELVLLANQRVSEKTKEIIQLRKQILALKKKRSI